MKENLVWLCLYCACAQLALTARPITPSVRIPLIDTTYRSPECYQSLLTLANAAGITIPYCVPSNRLAQMLCESDGVFLALDIPFLQHPTSAYAQLVVQALNRCFLTTPNKLLGLIVPESTTVTQLEPFLAQLNINIKSHTHDIELFLAHKKQCKPLYTTMRQSEARQTTPALQLELCTALPKRTEPDWLRNNIPLGIVCTLDNIHLFVTTLATVASTDLQENAIINPLAPEQRKNLLKAQLHMLSDLQSMIAKKRKERPHSASYRCLTALATPKMPPVTCVTFKQQQGSYKWTSNGIACGWMSMEYDKKLMPFNLACIAQSDIDILWLELPLGLYKEPELFDATIRTFASQLLIAYQRAHRPLPKIMIDFNLGAILKWYTRAQAARDIYGTTYQQIPAPLDYVQFWKPAILEILNAVCTRWSTIAGPLVTIDGIMFNLYFWHAKDTMPFYNNLVDISDTAWNWYIKHHSLIEPIVPANERASYLIRHDKLEEYFTTLEKGAYQLGQLVTRDIEKVLPCAIIGIYTYAPLDTWFYRGFAHGLGTQDRPLLWFTENLNFYGHNTWLKKHGICALHLTNVLLERFNDPEAIKIINKMAKTHDGLWYSRVSRIGQPYEADKWWSAEATTLEPAQVIKLINTQAHKK